MRKEGVRLRAEEQSTSDRSERSKFEERRTRIGEGTNLVVGSLKVKAVCVRLITPRGLMSCPQARNVCVNSCDVCRCDRNVQTDSRRCCFTVFGLLTSVCLCSV